MSLKATIEAAARPDLYIDPPSDIYMLGTIFTMPTKEGGRLGIAVPFKLGIYLIPVYTLLVTGIFYFIWQFTTYIILMAAPGGPTPIEYRTDGQEEQGEHERRANRDIALITIWNSGNPWTAMVPMLKHTWRMFVTVGDMSTGRLDIIILLLTAAATACNWGLSIYVPGNLSIGNAAPANPSKVSFPIQQYDQTNGADRLKLQVPLSSAAQRAVGIVDAASQSLKERVFVSKLEVMPWNGSLGQKIEQITYSYNITGVDLGLQHASGLFNSVKGACTLEYGWWQNTSNNNIDAYPVLGKNLSLSTDMAPTAHIFSSNDTQNTTYAVLFDTVGRLSYLPSNDAMYVTSPQKNSNGFYRVLRQRPALSCWQGSSWTYKGKTTNDVHDLKDIVGPDLPSILFEFIKFCFPIPRIVLLTLSLGPAVLISSTASISTVFDGASASWHDDMERLINAAFISSINIFRDATMPGNFQGLSNAANSTGSLAQGVGDFVLYSGKVTTLSPITLAVVPAVFLALCIIRGIFWLAKVIFENFEVFTTFNQRTIDLEAAQVYRMYDTIKRRSRDNWEGVTGRVPYTISLSTSRDGLGPLNTRDGSKVVDNVSVAPVRQGGNFSDQRAV